MSSTICIMGKTTEVIETCSALSRIADQHGYGMLSGLENVRDDCASGISQVISHYKLSVVASLVAPRDDEFRFSFGIIEEFYAYERNGLRPKFFEFISGVSELLHKTSEAFYVSFAGEWYEGDKVFLVDGGLNELLRVLERPGNVFRRFYRLSLDRFEDNDEIPLLARIHRLTEAGSEMGLSIKQ